MLHFIHDTFIRLPLSGSFIGGTASNSASRHEIIFNTDSSQNTANQQVLNRFHGIGLKSTSDPDNHGENRPQGIAPIAPKWADKRQVIAAMNELAVIILTTLNDITTFVKKLITKIKQTK